MALKRFVEVCDVGPMVFVMVDLHGFGVDVRFESVEWVRQRGTVNATGFSSDFEFELGFAVSASKRPGRAPPAQVSLHQRFGTRKKSAPIHGVLQQYAFASSRARGLYRYITKVVKLTRLRKAKLLRFPFASYWMRESAQMADSEITESVDVESRLSSSVIL